MRLSEINPLSTLKELLEDSGVTETIYVGNKPTANVPNAYIELRQNGGLKTNLTKMGLTQGYVLISINVSLLLNGGRNTVKENLILASFDGLFKNGAVANRDGYTFALDPNNLVYSGGGIYEGYSSRLINVTFNKI